ncbi:hypothetical protein KTQ42_20820 [Noviherbaspirillum sp. L7-7A]|uniref:hypothetical protein n=1 Tax=Noviherbaspirillum sp. L7-7A TaxID=2850560 RepID=UPI001C2CBAEB|nr:hypothetical protein [Noviherbaspirillum sp. L7-7A]MBV0881729.1 hypothetical protein [Noviherbaspirillum sp. L7-7A]
MHTPYLNRDEFERKAGMLADALQLQAGEAQQLLAQISGYGNAAVIDFGHRDRSLCSSREELVARLQASRPEVEGAQAAGIIDRLDLAVRDGDIEHVPASPGVVPNMGG